MSAEFLGFQATARALAEGKILILPTDTLPGIHCRADDQETVLRIAQLKGRDDCKPLLILAGSLAQAKLACEDWTFEQNRICNACWPGPFSLILPAGPLLAKRVVSAQGTVAIRVPAISRLRDLILEVGAPLVSTSANFQGERPLENLTRAAEHFGSLVDGIWAPPAGAFPQAIQPTASALVDLSGQRPMVLREGPKGFPASLDPNPPSS